MRIIVVLHGRVSKIGLMNLIIKMQDEFRK